MWSFAGDSIIDRGEKHAGTLGERSAVDSARPRSFRLHSGGDVRVRFRAAGCNSKPAESGPRFHLHGKIVSVHVKNRSADVDHDAIPGFMDAMTMSYPVPDAKVLATLARGDEITADVVVTEGVPHLENVVIVKKAPQPKPDPASSSNFHMPQPGDAVPDFALLDQNGKRIHLRSFRGDALLLTFIYTRCPFADFCPKVSDNFAHMYATLRKETGPAIKDSLAERQL